MLQTSIMDLIRERSELCGLHIQEVNRLRMEVDRLKPKPMSLDSGLSLRALNVAMSQSLGAVQIPQLAEQIKILHARLDASTRDALECPLWNAWDAINSRLSASNSPLLLDIDSLTYYFDGGKLASLGDWLVALLKDAEVNEGEDVHIDIDSSYCIIRESLKLVENPDYDDAL